MTGCLPGVVAPDCAHKQHTSAIKIRIEIEIIIEMATIAQRRPPLISLGRRRRRRRRCRLRAPKLR